MTAHNDHIIASILAKKNFNITAVNNLQDIDCMLFDEEQYAAICSFIKEKNWEALKSIIIPAEELSQYLSIHTFTDQNQKKYAATSLDSDELWEDPVIKDILPL